VRQLTATAQVRRRKPGTLAKKEIMKYQTSTQLLFRRLPFARLVRDIMRRVGRQPLPGYVDEDIEYRISADALEALQTATEDFLAELFATSVLCSTHANRVTLMAKDMNLVGRIRDKEWDKILRR